MSGRTERHPGWTPVMLGFLQLSLDASRSLSRGGGSSPSLTQRDMKTDEIVGWEVEGPCVPQAGKQLPGRDLGGQIGGKQGGGITGGCGVSSEDGTTGG